jgi:hypothetical protein
MPRHAPYVCAGARPCRTSAKPASPAPVQRTRANDIAHLARMPKSALYAPPPRASQGGVVQRSVLHIQVGGSFRHYSDLEVVGKRDRLTTYATKEEAKAADDKLAADPQVLSKAIVTSQNRDRRVPTPYGHVNITADKKVRHQDQGPHSLAFISLEQRLQNRLRKGQHAELAEQIQTPEEAGAKMTEEYGLADSDPRHQRYMLDYRSLHGEFQHRLANDADHGIGSAFHLVTRKLQQLDPYTTYQGPKSTYRAEDRHGILGSATIDPGAKSYFRNKKAYEGYLQTRGDEYHSSDEEEEGHAPKPGATAYGFTKIPARGRKYARKPVTRESDSSSSSNNNNTTTTTTTTASDDANKKRDLSAALPTLAEESGKQNAKRTKREDKSDAEHVEAEKEEDRK